MSGLRYFHGAFRKGIKGTVLIRSDYVFGERERKREREGGEERG